VAELDAAFQIDSHVAMAAALDRRYQDRPSALVERHERERF
jgi:hypothetical protein